MPAQPRTWLIDSQGKLAQSHDASRLAASPTGRKERARELTAPRSCLPTLDEVRAYTRTGHAASGSGFSLVNANSGVK